MTKAPRTMLRDHAREAVRRQIADTALRLFAARGFANVTVEDIVTAAGTSPRTFHRYFSAKEETVLVDAAEHGRLVARALTELSPRDPLSPQDPLSPRGPLSPQDPWTAMRHALEPLVRPTETDGGTALQAMRVLLGTPSLRARNLQKHQEWAGVLVPALQEIASLDGVQARAVVLGALACFDAALEEWVDGGGEHPLAPLLDRAFAAVGYR